MASFNGEGGEHCSVMCLIGNPCVDGAHKLPIEGPHAPKVVEAEEEKSDEPIAKHFSKKTTAKKQVTNTCVRVQPARRTKVGATPLEKVSPSQAEGSEGASPKTTNGTTPSVFMKLACSRREEELKAKAAAASSPAQPSTGTSSLPRKKTSPAKGKKMPGWDGSTEDNPQPFNSNIGEGPPSHLSSLTSTKEDTIQSTPILKGWTPAMMDVHATGKDAHAQPEVLVLRNPPSQEQSVEAPLHDEGVPDISSDDIMDPENPMLSKEESRLASRQARLSSKERRDKEIQLDKAGHPPGHDPGHDAGSTLVLHS